MANSNWAANAANRLVDTPALSIPTAEFDKLYGKPEPLTFTKEQMRAAFQAGYDHAHAEATEQLRQLMACRGSVTGRVSVSEPNCADIPRRDYGGGKHK